MNSRKIALSTGWLPPDPTPMKAEKVQIATKFGLPAPTNPDIAEISKVILNASLLPMKSAVIGHTEDPTTRPAYFATVRKAIRRTANSVLTGGLMIVMACIQNCSTL